MIKRTPQPNRFVRAGQALVPVILVMLIFTVLALALAGSAMREVHSGANFMRQTQRFYASKGAVNYAMSALAQSSNNGATWGIISPTPDTDANGWRQIGEAWVKSEAWDTGAFLNINGADQAQLQKLPLFRDNSELLQAIMEWKTPLDPNSSQSPQSAEYYQGLPTPYECKSAPFDTVEELLLVKGVSPSLLYGSVSGTPLPPGGQDPNGAGFSVQGGMGGRTRQATNPPPNGGGQPPPNGGGGQPPPNNGGQNPSDGPPSDQNAQDFDEIFQNSQIPLAELLGTVSEERNVSADGKKRINVNTATEEELNQSLQLPQNVIQALVNYRQNGNNNGGNNTPNTGTQPPPNGGSTPNLGGNSGRPRPGGGRPRPGVGGNFSGRQSTQPPPPNGGGQPPNGGGQPPNTGNNANTGNGNQPANPFRSLGDVTQVQGLTRANLQSLLDKIAIDDEPVRRNVVNVNTAPSEVLATLPGMTRRLLDAIVSRRKSGNYFQTLGDLLLLEEVDAQALRSLLPVLTTKTSTYIVRVKVRFVGQLSMSAFMAVVEMTEKGPRILQWREVPRLPGWSAWIAPPQMPQPGAQNSESAPETPL